MRRFEKLFRELPESGNVPDSIKILDETEERIADLEYEITILKQEMNDLKNKALKNLLKSWSQEEIDHTFINSLYPYS